MRLQTLLTKFSKDMRVTLWYYWPISRNAWLYTLLTKFPKQVHRTFRYWWHVILALSVGNTLSGLKFIHDYSIVTTGWNITKSQRPAVGRAAGEGRAARHLHPIPAIHGTSRFWDVHDPVPHKHLPWSLPSGEWLPVADHLQHAWGQQSRHVLSLKYINYSHPPPSPPHRLARTAASLLRLIARVCVA